MSECGADWTILQEAIGHLSPTEKLHLIEEVARSLRTPAVVPDDESRKTKIDQLRNDMAALPIHNADDGFTNREHDQLLLVEEELQQFEDLKQLREAKAAEADSPTLPLDAVKKELGL